MSLNPSLMTSTVTMITLGDQTTVFIMTAVMPKWVTHFAPAMGLELGLMLALFLGALPYIRLFIGQRPPPGLREDEDYFSRSEKRKKHCSVFLISKRNCQTNAYITSSASGIDHVTQGKEPS